jgi:hypothetical protein
LLDPTQEQFSVPPDAEPNAQCYVERTRRVSERAAIEVTLNEGLALQTWNEERRQLVGEVVRRHALTIDTHALLEAHRPLMERITNELNVGKLSLTLISELGPG